MIKPTKNTFQDNKKKKSTFLFYRELFFNAQSALKVETPSIVLYSPSIQTPVFLETDCLLVLSRYGMHVPTMFFSNQFSPFFQNMTGIVFWHWCTLCANPMPFTFLPSLSPWSKKQAFIYVLASSVDQMGGELGPRS